MINLDKIKKAKAKAAENMSAAFKNDDMEALQSAFDEYGSIMQEVILDEAKATTSSIDRQVLSTRGLRVLTSSEESYFNSFISAAKAETASTAKMQIDNIMENMPITWFESILGDIETNHPLLTKINFKNTTGVSKFFLNDQGAQLAQWGPLTDEFKKQLKGGIKVIDMTLCKLTAYFIISKDMLLLGPAWIDRYIREILVEALALGLETGIVTGSGNNEPIGMIKNIADDAAVVNGVYPDKTPIKVTDFSPKSYADLCVTLTKGPNDQSRPLNNLIMVVNPTDYLCKIMPATTFQSLGTAMYIGNILPLPTDIIQSAAVPSGKAIIGLSDKYFMGIGMARNGKIEYDDSVHFLEDERAYTIRTYGNGRACDNNCFVVADISVLEPSALSVKTISPASGSSITETVTDPSEA